MHPHARGRRARGRARSGADGGGGEGASVIERRASRAGVSVGAGWVALREVVQGGGDFGEDGRAAGVVEKNSLQMRALGPRSAPAVVGLVDELLQRALEVLQVQVKVEDLVDADRLAGGR